jgi:hypothetical protein
MGSSDNLKPQHLYALPKQIALLSATSLFPFLPIRLSHTNAISYHLSADECGSSVKWLHNAINLVTKLQLHLQATRLSIHGHDFEDKKGSILSCP